MTRNVPCLRRAANLDYTDADEVSRPTRDLQSFPLLSDIAFFLFSQDAERMVSFLEEAEEDVPPPGGRASTKKRDDDEDWVETGRGSFPPSAHLFPFCLADLELAPPSPSQQLPELQHPSGYPRSGTFPAGSPLGTAFGRLAFAR